MKVISAACRSHALRMIDPQSPARDIHFVRAVIERLAGPVNSEPVPVIGLHIVLIRTARRGALPEVPIELRWDGRFFSHTNRPSHIAVPGFGKVGCANQSRMDLSDDLDGVR